MNRVYLHGWGAVSPAGWGSGPLVAAVQAGTPLPQTLVNGPHGAVLSARRVPIPTSRPAWLAQPRLRRSSTITHFTVSAALEALAQSDAGPAGPVNRTRLGVVCNVFGGSVIYSRRFFEEVLQNPQQASPLLFPETVFNAPASHLGAVLGSPAPNHTLIGDQTTFLQGLAVAADWLADTGLDACVVVGAEEWDWSTATAARLFDQGSILGEGAGALVLRRCPGPVELRAISDPAPYLAGRERAEAVDSIRAQLAPWQPASEFPDAHARSILGDGLAASGAWSCVAAIAALAGERSAVTSAVTSVVIAGANLQALGAVFGTGRD